MATLGLPIDLKFDATLGAAFCGFAASSIVYGVLCAQIWRYYNLSFHKVDKYFKYLVVGVWVGETVDQAFIGHFVYYYTVTNYTNPLSLLIAKPVPTLILQMTVGAIVGCMVKTAFSFRVWRISNHNLVLTAFLVSMTYLQLAIAIWYTAQSFSFANLTEISENKTVGSLALGAGVITDIAIATALCYYIRGLRTEFSRSNALVRSLIVHAIDTGILTSTFSLTTLILYNLNSNNFIFVAFYVMVSKLYATTFLAAMNGRQSIVHGISTSDYRSTDLGSKVIVLGQTRSASRGHTHGNHGNPTEVHMRVEIDPEMAW